MPPSSRGLGRSPLKAKTGVQIPLGVFSSQALSGLGAVFVDSSLNLIPIDDSPELLELGDLDYRFRFKQPPKSIDSNKLTASLAACG